MLGQYKNGCLLLNSQEIHVVLNFLVISSFNKMYIQTCNIIQKLGFNFSNKAKTLNKYLISHYKNRDFVFVKSSDYTTYRNLKINFYLKLFLFYNPWASTLYIKYFIAKQTEIIENTVRQSAVVIIECNNAMLVGRCVKSEALYNTSCTSNSKMIIHYSVYTFSL